MSVNMESFEREMEEAMGKELSTATQLINERHKTHGRFQTNAEIAQEIKATMRAAMLWDDLSVERKEALDFIASKISRILSGKSDFADHWQDIAGYAELARK